MPVHAGGFFWLLMINRPGFRSLAEGAKVSYEIITDCGKESAGNLRLG
jgi:CspA family cold shock protein